MFVIQTWCFILERFETVKTLGEYDTEAPAVAAMWAEIRCSGKDMSRFRVIEIKA